MNQIHRKASTNQKLCNYLPKDYFDDKDFNENRNQSSKEYPIKNS